MSVPRQKKHFSASIKFKDPYSGTTQRLKNYPFPSFVFLIRLIEQRLIHRKRYQKSNCEKVLKK